MFKTHFLLAIRHFWKNKTISFINLTGLSLGIVAFVLILQYVSFEWSYNRMYVNADQVYRIVEASENEFYQAPGYAPVLAGQFPAVEAYTRLIPDIGNGVVQPETEQDPSYFRENKTAFVDSGFLSLFDRPLIQGEAGFSGPKQLLLSASAAKKYFGSQAPVGKTLQIDNQFGSITYTVVGVFEDFPPNTDYSYDVLLAISTLESPENRNTNDWADPNSLDNGFSFLFVKLQDDADAEALGQACTQWIQEAAGDDKLQIAFQPLSEIHLGKSLYDPLPQYGNRSMVIFLLCIAALILAIALVNYVNLSTAQGMERAKEVGIRKVTGARRPQLAYQYLLETFLIASLAVLVAFAFLPIIQPGFNRLVGQPLSLDNLWSSFYFWMGAGILLVGTLVAGGYVAFILTGFAPIQSLKGAFSTSPRGTLLRKGLVVAQFAISIALIAGTLILFLQLRFVKNRELGVKVNQHIAIQGPSVKGENYGERTQVFRDKLGQLPFVNAYCSSGGIPGTHYNFSANQITRTHPNPGDEEISYSILFIDERYIETYQIPLLAGRNFSADEAQKGFDAKKVIFNETALKSIGFESPREAIGAIVKWGDTSWEIIGVMKDYNHRSLHIPVEPIIFIPGRNNGYFTIDMNMEDFSIKKTELAALYAETFPGNPFEFEFLDETYAKLYESEQRLGKLFSIGSLLAIFISAMGLLGLASFVAKQKTKEIGIRKVLGATVSQIIQLLSQDFLKLVLFSFFIAAPIAWYVMNTWLKNFAYRIDIPLWVFTLSGLGAAFLAFLTIGIQGMRVATANPVDSLRNE